MVVSHSSLQIKDFISCYRTRLSANFLLIHQAQGALNEYGQRIFPSIDEIMSGSVEMFMLKTSSRKSLLPVIFICEVNFSTIVVS